MTNKRKTILLIIIFLAAGSLLLGKILADRQAAAFTRAITASQEQRSRIIELGQELSYVDKTVTDRRETSEELAAIKGQCSKLNELTAITKKASAPTTLAANPLGLLSSNYKSAQKIDVPVATTATLSAHTARLSHACNFYVLAVTIGHNTSKFTEQRAALITNDCVGADRCIAPESQAMYKQYFQEEREFSKQAAEALKKQCSFQELRKVCDLQFTYYQKLITLDDAYNKALDGSNNEVTEASQAYATNPYPDEQICIEVRRIAGLEAIQEDCQAQAEKALSGQYEASIKAEIAKL